MTNNNLNFGDALGALKRGLKVRRAWWHSGRFMETAGEFLIYRPEASLGRPSVCDIFAEDWEILEDQNEETVK